VNWEDAYPSFKQRPQTLPDVLRWRAEKNASETALVAPDGELTFAEWAGRVSAIARELRERGVQPRTPVGLWGENRRGCTWSSVMLGIQWAGAIPVPLHARLQLPGVAAALGRIDARYLVLDSDERVDGLQTITFDELPGAGDLDDPVPAPPDPAAILHTSGTTGLPTPVVVSHVSLAYVGAATEDHILGAPAGIDPLREGDVLQTAIMLSTSSGLLHVLAVGIYSGLKLVIEERFRVETTLETMRREQSKIWLGVPTMMVLLGDACPEPVEGVRIEAIWHMGSPVSEVALEGMRRAFPGAACLNLYSLTESMAAIYGSTAEDAILRPGTVGRPLPTTEVKLLREDGEPAEPGEVGRMFFRSVHMLDGYWRDGEIEPPELDDGWLDTADGAYTDAEGHAWVTGRVTDVIIRGGYNIHPAVVEAAILEHEAVSDVAVVPVQHRVLGQDVVAMVVARGDLDAETLRQHCLQRLADFEIPRTMIPVDELPRNEFGKLDRKVIRAQAEAKVEELRTTA
jgi:long-chain acyl-CoA synthetase